MCQLGGNISITAPNLRSKKPYVHKKPYVLEMVVTTASNKSLRQGSDQPAQPFSLSRGFTFSKMEEVSRSLVVGGAVGVRCDHILGTAYERRSPSLSIRSIYHSLT